MKKIYFILFIFSLFLISCDKDNAAMGGPIANCIGEIPAFCATVRCSAEGKPVCGCNNVTYGSVCEAQCAGVTAYTAGACK